VVSEQSTPVTAPTTATPATAPVVPATETTPPTNNTQTTTQPIKMGVKNPRVQVLQQLLNDKFQSGLVADGLYGPKTANAIYKNIVAINKLQLNPVRTEMKPAEIKQQLSPQIKTQQIPTTATVPR